MSGEDDIKYTITLHRTQLIPGGMGALIGFSDDYPDRQFLCMPPEQPHE